MPAQPRDFALVIGISHYPDYKTLDGAIYDADDFHRWLGDTDGGGLDPQHAHLIVSSTSPHLAPVQEQVDAALGDIRKKSAGGARRFYLYFAGHGMGSDTTELALCLPRWAPDWRRAALCLTGYVTFVVELGRFQQVAVFLDCCRARQVEIYCNPPMVTNIKPAPGAGQVESFTAYATEFDNLAYEAAIGPGGPVRGHFTRALMEALRGAAAGPQRGVQPGRLAGYVGRRTTELATDSGHNQKAHIPSLPVNQSNWIFGDYAPAAYNLRIEFDPRRGGEVSLEDSAGVTLGTRNVAAGPWDLNLEPALYSLVDRATGEEKAFRVRPAKEVQVERF